MAKVAYDYTVDGTPTSGDTVRFGNYAGALATAEADVAKYSGRRAGGSSLRSGQAADLDTGGRARAD